MHTLWFKLLKPGLNLNMQSQKDVQFVIEAYNDAHTICALEKWMSSERQQTQSTQLKDELKLCSKKWTMPEKDYHSKG